MKIAIIITTPDYAGQNIKENLLELLNFSKTDDKFDNYPIFKRNDVKLYTTDEKCTFIENLQDKIDANLFIIPTTHRSETNKKTISCHTQGNWDKADLGGIQKNISYAPAFYLKKTYNELVTVQKEMELDFEPTLECTHHGPQLEAPTMFVEIGSTETEWKDKKVGMAIAKVIAKLLEFNPDNAKWKSSVGIGGPHYCSTFNKIMNRTDIAIGHICPKYMLESVEKNIIKQAIEKTVPKPDFLVLDWKGLGKFKEKIKNILKDIGMPYKRTDQILKS